jgi:PAS domain S-box-containing protein
MSPDTPVNRNASLPLDQLLLRLVRSRLFIPLLVVSLAAIVVAGLLGVQMLENQQQQMVQSRAAMVDRYLDQADRMLDAVARVAGVSTPEETRTVMQGTLEAYQYFDTLYYLDKDSRIVQMVPPDVRYLGLDMSRMPSYRMSGEQTNYRISRPFISLRTGNPTVYLIRDVPSGGSVVGELSLDALQQEIMASKSMPGRDFVFILDQYGMLIAHPSAELVREQTNQGDLEIFRQGVSGPATLPYMYDGTLVLGSAARVDRTGWVVVDQVPVPAVFGSYALILGLTLVVLILIWLFLAWHLSGRLREQVVRPLEQLSRGVTALAEGDFGRSSTLSPVSGTFSELDRLAADFRLMNNAIQERQTALELSREELIRKNQDLHVAYEQLTAGEEELRANYEEVQRTEAALRQSENRLRGVADHIPGIVFQFYARPAGEWGLYYVNERSTDLLGIDNTPDDFFQRFSVGIVPAEREKFLASVDAAIRKEKMWDWEGRFTRPDGRELYLRGIAEPVKTDNELVFSGVLLDMTGRKRAENSLRESEDRYRKLVEISPDAVILHREGKIIFLNPAALNLLGASHADEIIGKPVLEFIQPDFRDAVRRSIEKDLMGTITPPMELPMLRLNGSSIIVEGRGVKTSIEGKPAIQVALRDITERKLAEEALQKSGLEWQTTFNAITDAVFLLDDRGRIIRHNRAFETFTGKPADEIDGRYCYDVMHGTASPVEGCPNVKAQKSRQRESIELKIGNRWVIVAVDPIIAENGNFSGAVHLLIDITERKRAEEALNQARRKLNMLNSITFSDIQNAIFSLAGYFELEKTLQMDEKLRQYKEKETRLVQTIAESLKFTGIYQSLGLKPPVWQNVNQCFLFGISHLDLSPLSRRLEAGGVEIYADPLLENVFFALAENVVRHGRTATELTLRYQESKEGLVLFFEDNGTGIPDELKGKIFEQEYGRRKGLGLFLSREILSITGITIRETGEAGKGARFEILVPKEGYRITEEPGSSKENQK